MGGIVLSSVQLRKGDQMTKCFAQRALIGFYMLIPVFVLSFSGKLVAQSENIRRQPVEMAALHGELVWQRTSPTVQRPEGPVLYQNLFRSSARPGFVPKIDSNFTLTNSLITEDNAG